MKPKLFLNCPASEKKNLAHPYFQACKVPETTHIATMKMFYQILLKRLELRPRNQCKISVISGAARAVPNKQTFIW
jgi:hypothetical protein